MKSSPFSSLMDGNLTLKSSVLSPISRRIFDQFNAVQHLKTHHRLIATSKAIVDTAAPKSMSKSVVRKDQKKRSEQLSSKSSSRTNSRLSSSSISKSLETLPNSQSLPKESSSKSSVNSRTSSVAEKISWYLEAIQQSAIPVMPWNTFQEMVLAHESPYTKTFSKKVPVTSSVPSRHLGCFESSARAENPKPLAYTKVESKLKRMEHCYNPSTKHKKPSSRKAATREAKDLERILQEHLRQLEHQETCYEKWLQDQAQRAEVRKEALTSRKSHSSGLQPPMRQTTSSLHTPHLNLRSSDSGRETDKSSLKAHTRREEDKQLEFAVAVTEDILRSGLFSDKAIKQTIKLHLEEKPPDIDEDKAQLLVEQLMMELCIDGDHKDIVRSSFRR